MRPREELHSGRNPDILTQKGFDRFKIKGVRAYGDSNFGPYLLGFIA
jgi:hypothetical protein